VHFHRNRKNKTSNDRKNIKTYFIFKASPKWHSFNKWYHFRGSSARSSGLCRSWRCEVLS